MVDGRAVFALSLVFSHSLLCFSHSLLSADKAGGARAVGHAPATRFQREAESAGLVPKAEPYACKLPASRG